MKKRKKNKTLRVKIWIFFLFFSFFILLFLWATQVLFFDTYYETNRRKELKEVALNIKKYYGEEEFYDYLDTLSYDEGVCIDIEKNGYVFYRTSSFNRGCLERTKSQYKKDFRTSDEEMKLYEIYNEIFQNQMLVYAIKLDSSTFAFTSVSLEPLDSATRLLKKQLTIMSIFAICFSGLLSYYLARRISSPIEKMSEKASAVAQGNFSDNFSSSTDIKEIANLENSLNRMKEEFEKTEELRRDLMANVSHDLKTPLTMIKAYAEMVRDLTYKNKEKREENLNVIIEETDRLNLLVDDILTLSSMQSDTYPLVYSDFSLNQLIHSVLQKYEVLLEKEQYHFLYEEKELWVHADRNRTEQVIYNILNNAINYTGDDKTIMIRVTEKEKTVLVEIKDSGKGIPASEIDNVWNKYYHSAKKHKRNRVGTGLGLAIVKKILDGYHLPYGILSKENEGTTFYFELEKQEKKKNK